MEHHGTSRKIGVVWLMTLCHSKTTYLDIQSENHPSGTVTSEQVPAALGPAGAPEVDKNRFGQRFGQYATSHRPEIRCPHQEVLK